MKQIITLIVSLFILTNCITAKEKPQELKETNNPSGFNVERLDYIDSAFARMVNDNKMPHAITMVVHKGEIVHYKAFGWRDKEAQIPCERTDIFRIASQTKAITVVALMTLWEKGLFQLDEPIKKYIPAFENPQVLVDYDKATKKWTSRKASRDITIRDLMSHTSGISYKGIHWDIMESAEVPPLNTLKPYTLKDVVNRLAKLPLEHDPGAQFTYSMNIEVLGRLIEILSGKSVDVFLKESIFDPLGMTDTYFYLPKEKEDRLVKLYTYPKGGPLQLSKHEIYQNYPVSGAKTFFSTGAGLSGTILDYAKFCQMILNDGEFNNNRILGRKTLEMMQRNNVGDLRGDIGFSLAWDVFRDEYIYKTIASEGTMRWGGMFGTDYMIDPKEELIVMMYVNWSHNGTGTDTKQLMHNVTYQALK